ncbi:MAG: alternative ribosome rescue aminoacyl-tRNA hydrolase ArfB [Melioribacteraceae bacterium]
MIEITNKISLSENELQFSFVRASGPGGQNVDKVSTVAQLRFNLWNNKTLPTEVKERLQKLAGKRFNSDGTIFIDARRFRSQERNKQDAINRLIDLIKKAIEKPKPRKKTKPTKAAKLRRLESKRKKGDLKKNRTAMKRDSFE